MKLYLLRHAEASYDAPSDDERHLTEKGVHSVENLARLMKPKEFSRLGEIWHSGLVRAEQTAQIFNDSLELELPLTKVTGLRPEDPPLQRIDQYLQSQQDIMIVGHNPHLTRLASALLTGDVFASCVEFKKCGLMCLERFAPAMDDRATGHWLLRWFVVPKIVPKEGE